LVQKETGCKIDNLIKIYEKPKDKKEKARVVGLTGLTQARRYHAVYELVKASKSVVA